MRSPMKAAVGDLSSSGGSETSQQATTLPWPQKLSYQAKDRFANEIESGYAEIGLLHGDLQIAHGNMAL